MDDEELYSVFDQEFGIGTPEAEAAPLAVVPPDLQSQVLGLFSQIGENRKRGDALRQQQLEQATRMLEQRKFGPSMAERLFQLSAAFAAPTRTRGLAGVLGNVMPVLAEQASVRRAADEKREDTLRDLRNRYALMGVENEGAGYKEQLAALKTAAAMAPKPVKPRLALDPLGRGVVNLDDASMTPIGGGGIARVSTPDEARRLPPGTRFQTPDGRILMVPGGPTGSAPSGGFRNTPSGSPLERP